MQTIDLVRLFADRLQRAEIKYMVTGSVACTVYGEPRLTHDVDLVVEMSIEQIDSLQKAFPSVEFYVPPAEIMAIAVRSAQRGSFNIVHHETGFKGDFYLVGRDALQRWGLMHAKELEVGGGSISLAPPEYVIIRKLEFFREGGSEKHLRDIAGVLRHLSELMDSRELLNRLESLGLETQWRAVLQYLSKG